MDGALPRPRRGTGSLTKALRLLQEIGSAGPDALRLTELVGRANIDASTAFRMLACLVDEEFVEKVEGKRYRLGRRVFELGLAAGQHFNGHAAARSTLWRLAGRLNMPVTLVMRSRVETVSVESGGPELFPQLAAPIGSRLPIGVDSAGVALLAAMAPGDADALIRANERRYRAFGRDTARALRSHVDRAKVNGYARTISPLCADVGSVGIIVPGEAASPSFALSILCDASRLQDGCEMVPTMRAAAQDIAHAIAAAQKGPSEPGH
jgi:DNA-binding IclR family transcriptional regulator